MGQLRYIGDEILTKQCKPVKEITPRTAELIEDMFETVYESFGARLTASQVGVLKQIMTIDVDDGHQYVLINPGITEGGSERIGPERCLNVPGKSDVVTRPQKIKMRTYGESMEQLKLEGEDLPARYICHECAHLKGKLYITRVEGELTDVTADDGKKEEE